MQTKPPLSASFGVVLKEGRFSYLALPAVAPSKPGLASKVIGS